jgi:hypothetical protein
VRPNPSDFVSAWKHEKDEGPHGHHNMKAFMKDANIVKRAADTAMSVAGKSAGRSDKCGEVFGQSIVQAMVMSSCMGQGTNYFHCHQLFSGLNVTQVTLMKWCICV